MRQPDGVVLHNNHNNAGKMLWANPYLQFLDVHRALVQAVVSERHVKVTGEARLSHLQPAMELLQAGEQGDAKSGGV